MFFQYTYHLQVAMQNYFDDFSFYFILQYKHDNIFIPTLICLHNTKQFHCDLNKNTINHNNSAFFRIPTCGIILYFILFYDGSIDLCVSFVEQIYYNILYIMHIRYTYIKFINTHLWVLSLLVFYYFSISFSALKKKPAYLYKTSVSYILIYYILFNVGNCQTLF